MHAKSSKSTLKKSSPSGTRSSRILNRWETPEYGPSLATLLKTPAPPEIPCISEIRFTEDYIVIELQDGRVLSVPLEWSVLLRDASRVDLENYEIDVDGTAIHWHRLDEDLRIVDLLYPPNVARGYR